MLPLKGIWKDSPLSKHPTDFAYEIVNGVIGKNVNSITNENGCVEHSSNYNSLGYQQLGLYNAKKGIKIIFSKGGGLDRIGIIDANGIYTEKVSGDLGFNIDYPVDCESYYNYKGELIIAFTDYLNTPKLINLDEITLPFNLNDIQLYSFFTQPQVVADIIETGGSLKTGAYFPFFGYKNDDMETPFTAIENPIFITNSTLSDGVNGYEGAPAGTSSGKLIKLTLNNVDTSYDVLTLGVIIKIDGVLQTKLIKEVPITGSSMIVNYTGAETSTDITIEEVITPSAVYEKIKHFTQINGVLYGAYTSEAAPINFQMYANLIKLKWTSKLLDVTYTLGDTYKINQQNNINKSFKHEEVYAFYIRLKIKGRGFTQAFHIPGRAAEGTEASLYSTLGAGYDVQNSISNTARYFQIDDTSAANGKFGFWQNEDETYPNTTEFAPVNGSEDLRGKKVRHHRFPSIRKTKELLYAGGSYGRSTLDSLGIEVDSFPTLPPDLASIVEGYTIYYAKRSVNNSTVNAQSLMLNNHNSVSQPNIYWGAGNWNVRSRVFVSLPLTTWFVLNQNEVRFHSFDLMLDKPAIAPNYLSTQIGMRAGLGGNHIISNGNYNTALHIDYTTDSSDIGVSTANKFKKISNFKYIPSNIKVDNYENRIGEEAAVAHIDGAGYGISAPTLTVNFEQPVSHEDTYLVNLMSYKTNMYNSYENQDLISTGKYIKIGDINRKIWGGDNNIVKFGFVTFGAVSLFQLLNADDSNSGVADGSVTDCLKMVRGYVTETNHNASLRHETDGDIYTKYYPKETMSPNSAWFLGLPRNSNPNKIAYNRDYSSLNEMNGTTIFSTKNKFIAEDPYRIIRSKIPNKEERQSSWKVFLANDYYIMPRDKGYITNIQGVGDNLFINHEETLYRSRGSEELATDSFKVVLGTGNIFDRPPVELIYEETGYAGCQHKFSCLLTRFGYLFVDEDRKKVFLVNDSIKDITLGLSNFFRDNLITSGDNPYRGKGYTVAWDDEFKRIILSSREAGFTRHYYPEKEAWFGKSNYFPDVLLGNRNSLFAINAGKIYKHNIEGIKGQYYNNEEINPFIVAIVARDEKQQLTLDNITWRTLYELDGNPIRDKTFTSILVWNSYQATGEIMLVPHTNNGSLINNYENSNVRRIKNIWNFNKIRNAIITRDTKFIDDIDLVPNSIDFNQAFYMKKPLSDDYIVIKLLFSNEKIGTLQADIQLLDLDINVNLVTR